MKRIEKIQIDIEKLVIPNFQPVLEDILAHGHTHYDFSGGRGSTKSSFVISAAFMILSRT